MKTILLAVSLFIGSFAHANDGSFIYLDVLGVAPGKMQAVVDTGKSLDVYGKDAIRFAQLFEYAPIHEAYQFDMISKSWNVSIWCPKYYTRPTTGENRDDFMCHIQLNKFSPEILADIKEYGDSDEVLAPLGTIDSGTVSVLGINPNGIQKGILFEVYGNNAWVLNQSLNNSSMVLQSKAYKVSVGCVETYIRPTTGEVRDDYKCTFSLQ